MNLIISGIIALVGMIFLIGGFKYMYTEDSNEPTTILLVMTGLVLFIFGFVFFFYFLIFAYYLN